MDDTLGGSEPSPARNARHEPPRKRAAAGEVDLKTLPDDVWFEVRSRDGVLVGTSERVVHVSDHPPPDGAAGLHVWSYDELRSLHVLEEHDGESIVIEPERGPLVPVPIPRDDREAAFQAATVFQLLIAQAHRAGAIRSGVRR